MYNAYQTVFNIITVAIFLAELNRLGVKAWGGRAVGSIPTASTSASPSGSTTTTSTWSSSTPSSWCCARRTTRTGFLHIYHHCLLIWAWWDGVYRVQEHGLRGCVLWRLHERGDSRHHVLLLPHGRAEDQCPWKQYITMAQMLQFAIVFAHSCYVIYDGHCRGFCRGRRCS